MALALFAWLPVEKAALCSLFGGYLLLPSGTAVDVALLPSIDKFSVTSVTTFLLCWMKGAETRRPKRSVLIIIITGVFILMPVATSFGNSYELSNAKQSIPGFYPLDALKYGVHNLIVLMPFFIGLRFFSNTDSRTRLLLTFPVSSLIYSLPMLIEVRLSPQFHYWVYGYFPHSFVQQVRDGGFRPVVFLSHGLEVALFTSLGLIGSIILVRAKLRIFGQSPSWAASYLSIILLFCKTLGAALYAIITAPLILFCKPRTWLTFASVTALIVCAYPLLRTAELIPIKQISDTASRFSADRGASFDYRVQNEDLLLKKANEKPLFGWGTWGRSRVYQNDTGDDLTVTDGTWIIYFGMFGWVGYLSVFGLFLHSILSARSQVDTDLTRANVVLAGLSLMLSVNLVDLLPNSNLLPFTYLVAGAIAGRSRTTTKLRRPSRAASGNLKFTPSTSVRQEGVIV